MTKFLDTAGNILVLIDEFDGDHQKLGLFCSETKSNTMKYVSCFLEYYTFSMGLLSIFISNCINLCFSSSAVSVLKWFHTGMPFYKKGKVSDSGHISNPQVSFLAASNGVRERNSFLYSFI